MTDNMIQRIYTIEDVDIKRVDRTGREVTAYATVFDTPTEIRDRHGHYYESINRNAFNRFLGRGVAGVQVFYNHGYDLTGKPNMVGAVPIATPLDIKPDTRGLVTRSRYNDGELADAVLAAWEGGQITGQSFSGKVQQDRKAGKRGTLDLVERTQLTLREYGPTHSPAYADAGLIAIRSDLEALVRSILPTIIATSADSPEGHPAELAETVTDSLIPSHSSQRERYALRVKRMRKTGVIIDATAS